MIKTGLFLFTLFWGALSLGHAALYSVGLDKEFYTSDFMIGDVVVAVIFPESDGSGDPETEEWTEERKTRVLSEIMAGHDWWIDQNKGSQLSFTYVTQTIRTKYEPITRPYYAEALWIPDVMAKLGYTGSRFTSTRKYVNDLRDEYKTDWAFIMFVVDSTNDANGKFSDGFFAYAYLGGPFLVLTYDNNGYGISNMDVVAAHETGHIFHALDEYAGASSPHDYSSGYFVTVNGNHAYSNIADNPDSIMRGGLRWGLSGYTKDMIGWRDADNNKIHDIIDQSPFVGSLISATDAGGGLETFNGETRVRVLPRQSKPQGYGFTVDSIAHVEYRIDNNEWSEAIPMDGGFDSAEEHFKVVMNANSLSASGLKSTDIQIRVTTHYAMMLDGDDSTTLSGTGSLGAAHPFPNPFKPNSKINHVDVQFTGLTPGAKVQIFTPAGEPVFEKIAQGNATTLTWNAVNDSGSSVSSGVYFYLITNEAGDVKKGKIAVIR